MSSNRSVQFRGIPAVIRAYENAGIAPFAIMCNGALFSKYQDQDIEGGKQFLQTMLKELSTGGGLATYTLAVYEDIKKGQKINSKTPYDMSFNFKLDDDYEEARGRRYGIPEYESRIAGLEEKIKFLTEEDENEQDPEAVGGIWGTFSKLLDHPQVSAAIAGKIVSVIDAIGKPGQVDPGAVSNFHAHKVAGMSHDAVQMEKIRRATDLLYKVDKNFGDHLLRLAEIALKDLAQYNSLIGMLEKM